MNKFKYVFAAVLVAGAAFAVRQVKYSTVNDPNPQWFQQGYYVGPPNSYVVNDTKNRVTRSIGCQVDYDFAGVIPRPGFIQETVNYPCVGVKLGDPCSVGVVNASPQDGGSAWEDNVNFFAIAKKDDKIVIRMVTASGDGGDMNPPDAGYKVRCTSNQ